MTTVEAIVELGLAGIKRTNQLAIYLYIRGHDVPAGRVLCGLPQEAERMVRQIRRVMPEADMGGMSSRARATFLRKMGDVDLPLAAVGDADLADLNAAVMKAAVWDEGFASLLATLFGQHFEATALANDLYDCPALYGIAGLFGEPDESESPAFKAIRGARPVELEEARQQTHRILAIAGAAKTTAEQAGTQEEVGLLRVLTATLTSPRWLIWLFTLNLNGIIRLRGKLS